jgi:hypothetical protein
VIVERAPVELVLELFENFVPLVAMQLFVELFQSQGNDVVVMGSGKGRIGGDLKPKMMQKVQILIAEARSMRPEIIFASDAVRQPNLHHDAWFRFG